MALQGCPAPLAPDTLNCSGRALFCINNGCICEEGWIGRGDFISGSPACHLNISGVRAAYGILLAVHVCHIPFCIRYLLIMMSKSTRSRAKDISLFSGLVCLFSSVAQAALGIVRLNDPSSTIGTSPAATILFSVGSGLFWTYVPLILTLLVQVLGRTINARNDMERNIIERLVKSFSKVSGPSWLCCMLACFCPLFMLIDPNDARLMFGFALSHYLFLTINMVASLLLTLWVIPPIIHDMRAVVETNGDPRAKMISKRLNMMKSEVRNQTVFQATSAAIFGCWLYAQRYSSYQLPIAWTGSAFLMAFGLNAALPSGQANRSSALSTSPQAASPVKTKNVKNVDGIILRMDD